MVGTLPALQNVRHLLHAAPANIGLWNEVDAEHVLIRRNSDIWIVESRALASRALWKRSLQPIV